MEGRGIVGIGEGKREKQWMEKKRKGKGKHIDLGKRREGDVRELVRANGETQGMEKERGRCREWEGKKGKGAGQEKRR